MAKPVYPPIGETVAKAKARFEVDRERLGIPFDVEGVPISFYTEDGRQFHTAATGLRYDHDGVPTIEVVMREFGGLKLTYLTPHRSKSNVWICRLDRPMIVMPDFIEGIVEFGE